jgi:3-phenylpropionate/trans-cinnamate dioxygenase ferredoxin component
MANFVKAAAAADVKPGTATCVEVNGKPIALFNVDGTFYATDNTCAHLGGPLGEGELEGTVITCPWHNWQYDVRTGESITDDLKVDTYQVKVEGGDVLVAV